MRAAIVHYWLLNRRGGEKVLDALCRLLPEADIFTLFCDPEVLSPELRRHKITTSFLNPLRRGYRSLLPLMRVANSETVQPPPFQNWRTQSRYFPFHSVHSTGKFPTW